MILDSQTVRAGWSLFAAAAVGALLNAFVPAVLAEGTADRSPFDLAYSPDGKTLIVSDRTAARAVLVNVAECKVQTEVPLNGRSAGVACPGGATAFVAEYDANAVAEFDVGAGKIIRRLPAGPYPIGVALVPRRKLLIVTNTGDNSVSFVDLAEAKERARIAVPREPYFVAVRPDESLAVVGNLLSDVASTDPRTSAAVSLIDLEKPACVANVRLPAGSTNVRALAISPNGRWAYVVHTLGRFSVPTTQIERGWINTNALSLIDLNARQHYVTVLLDHPSEGSADPWGAVLSKDGATLWVSLAGQHQLARIDVAGLHKLLDGKSDKQAATAPSDGYNVGTRQIWLDIKQDPAKRELLVNDLSALYVADLIVKVAVPGKGPRGLVLSPDGKQLAVAAYFSGNVILADAATGKAAATIPFASAGEPTQARRGEIIFHDATVCFQQWLSCATCHPDARADGLNWDLLNDGIGNPKNTKSLLLSHLTPPAMAQGVRESMEAASLAGFRHILFREPEPGEVDAVQAYLRSLQPERSPRRLPNGDLSPRAQRGKAVFERPETKCTVCHPAPLFTDLRSHDVGTRHQLDREADFDTPTLIEMWRTAPYLHDGSAVTLQDVLTKFNEKDQHGVTSKLPKEELDDLVEYLLSL